MRVLVLSRNSRLYSTKRLVEAVRARGHVAKVMDTADFSVSLEEETPAIFYRGEEISIPDAIIPRVGASITYFGTSVVRQFEQLDVFSANSALGISNSRDKLRSLQLLARHDIGIPPTEFVSRRIDVLPAIERLGGAPVIIKLLEGTQGVGVILAEEAKIAEAIVETLRGAKQDVLLQKFVAESSGRDVRAIVVGDRVVAAMRRVAQGTEFRSNVHRGGRAEPIELDKRYARTAVRATQILGLRVAGVDMLESSSGPQVMEVNSSPGLQGIERATGIDVAGAIADYVIDQIKFPELDIRQRLTVSHHFAVAEFPVPRNSVLAGKTIADCGLAEQDVTILSVTREGEVWAVPRGSLELRVGDRLLCFGRTQALKALVPDRKRRRRRKKREIPVA